MPLRKKHVRRIVLTLVVLGVLGPALGLVLYGLHLRGGACGAALRQELQSRLRCQADVVGAAPTGPSSAVARAVDLAWAAPTGELRLRLEDLTAEHNRFGWYVRAARGDLALDGRDPLAALAALSQRLVQVQDPPDLMAVTVDRLRLDLAMPPLRVRTEVRATALSNMAAYAVAFHAPGPDEQGAARRGDEAAGSPLAMLRLDPASHRGVFGGFRMAMSGAPLGLLCRALGAEEKAAASTRGTMDLAIDWFWPGADARKAIVRVTARGLDLAEWTGGVPGGPMTGTADVEVRYERPRDGPSAATLQLDAPAGGQVRGETLAWLQNLPAGLKGLVRDPGDAVYQAFRVRYSMVGDRGWYGGETDPDGTLPVMTASVFGRDLPLLRATDRPFGTSGLLEALRGTLIPSPSPAEPTEAK